MRLERNMSGYYFVNPHDDIEGFCGDGRFFRSYGVNGWNKGYGNTLNNIRFFI